MIQITRLVQQKNVRESKKENRRRNAVKKSRHHASGRQAEHNEVNVHPRPGPGFYPTESVVSESDGRFNVVTRDPVVGEVAINLPQHDAAEEDAEENEEGDVDRLEESGARTVQKLCFRTVGSRNERRGNLHFLRWSCLHVVANVSCRRSVRLPAKYNSA